MLVRMIICSLVILIRSIILRLVMNWMRCKQDSFVLILCLPTSYVGQGS